VSQLVKKPKWQGLWRLVAEVINGGYRRQARRSLLRRKGAPIAQGTSENQRREAGWDNFRVARDPRAIPDCVAKLAVRRSVRRIADHSLMWAVSDNRQSTSNCFLLWSYHSTLQVASVEARPPRWIPAEAVSPRRSTWTPHFASLVEEKRDIGPNASHDALTNRHLKRASFDVPICEQDQGQVQVNIAEHCPA